MPLDLTVSDATTRCLNDQAKLAARECVEAYAGDVLKEAGRLEAASRATDGDPEITSSMVRDADLLLRRGYRQPRRKPWLVVAQILAPVGGVVTGFLGQADFLKKPNLLALFVVTLTITVVSSVVSVFKD